MKVEDGSLRIRSTRTAHAYVGRRRRGAGRCARDSSTPATWSSCAATDIISSDGAAASSISAASRFIRKKSKPSSTGMPRCACRAPNRGAARSPAPSWSPMSFWPTATTPAAATKSAIEILADCRASLASYKVPAVIRFVPSLDITRGRKAGPARCIMFWSPEAAAASALPSREGLPRPATMSSRWRGAKATN